MKTISIKQCNIGYLVTEHLPDNSLSEYAITESGLVKQIKALLGITEKKNTAHDTTFTVPRPKRKYKKREQKEDTNDSQGSCDDVAFESCANNKPENCKFCVDQSRYEDKKKG